MRRTAVRWMVCCLITIVASFLVFADTQAIDGQQRDEKKITGAREVDTVLYDWFDADRNREIPVKIYYPRTGEGPFPVVFFSHGLGGTREAAEYLGSYWASHGYVSVHLQHKGSDDSVWRGKTGAWREMARTARDPINSLNRPKDVGFAVGAMEKLNSEENPLKGRLDLSRLGIAGHSFGAYTALAIAGEIFVGPRGGEISFADPRFKAAVVMSAPVTPRQKAHAELAFSRIKIPCLHMTGTRDRSIIGATRAEDRRIPFDSINGPDQYLIVFTDADHMVLSGRRWMGVNKLDPVFHRLVQESSTSFWGAYLKRDPKARDWMAKGGIEATLRKYGKLEKKLRP